MRRSFFAILVFSVVAILSLSAIASPSATFPLYVIGHVNTSQELVITVNESVLPFDLEDDLVAENPNTNIISGLQVAYYSLFTNDVNFTFTITHTPLVLSGLKTEDSQFDSIDYRLYVVTNKIDTVYARRFKSCLSSDEGNDESDADRIIEITKNDINVSTTSMVSLFNYALYVSLEDKNRDAIYDTTAKVVENLSPGLYTSTIYFCLTGS